MELGNDKADKGYWICLSPACDLVPGQKTSGLFGRVKGSMPFTIVQLTKTGGSKALEDVSHNICLFLNIHNEINTFFHPGGQLQTPPVWGQIIAEKYSQFKNMVKELQIWRVGGFENDGIVMKK